MDPAHDAPINLSDSLDPDRPYLLTLTNTPAAGLYVPGQVAHYRLSGDLARAVDDALWRSFSATDRIAALQRRISSLALADDPREHQSAMTALTNLLARQGAPAAT